jgi:hypothetical protein
MKDDQVQSALETWFEDTDPQPPDPRQTAARVITRLPQTRQRGRWLPFALFREKAQAPTPASTIEYQPHAIPATNGHTPTVVGRTRSVLSPVWAIATGAIIFALGGALLIGEPFDQPASVPGAETEAVAYDAVFLRPDAADLLVIGVDPYGHEREITRFAGARAVAGPTTGVVSPSGLLAVTVPEPDNWMVHWEVVDLHRLDAPPIVIPEIEQDVEQLQPTPYYRTDRRPAVFWGPDEQLIIPWYDRDPSGVVDYQLAFVDGRSGSATSVDLPDEVKLLPYWAADGSGVVVGQQDEDPPVHLATLRPDGTVSEGTAALAPSASSRRYRADGAVVSLSRGRIVAGGASGPSLPSGITDAVWTAQGDGLWLVAPTATAGLEVMVDRLPLSDPVVMAQIPDDTKDPVGSRLRGDLIGLAPDDSMIVVSLDRMTGTESDGGVEPVSATGLLTPESGSWYEVEGSFAGWMEVER